MARTRLHSRGGENFANTSCTAPLSFGFAADYADIFEVRGSSRTQRGCLLPASVETRELVLGHDGLDGVTRRTHIEVTPSPPTISPSEIGFNLQLQSHETTTMDLCVAFQTEGGRISPLSYDRASMAVQRTRQRAMRRTGQIATSNDQFDDVLARAHTDLYMLTTETPEGPYPYAGVPWFSTPFGRDGLITAWAVLWLNPAIAWDVLSYLAAA